MEKGQSRVSRDRASDAEKGHFSAHFQKVNGVVALFKNYFKLFSSPPAALLKLEMQVLRLQLDIADKDLTTFQKEDVKLNGSENKRDDKLGDLIGEMGQMNQEKIRLLAQNKAQWFRICKKV